VVNYGVRMRRSIVFNGDLGGGKTTVSTLLAARLGIRRVSVGDLFRAAAEQRGMTALQFNLHAELDDEIDRYVDRLQADIAAGGRQLVVDSRLAWHFFTDALKVHIIADPMVAATRALQRPADPVESYGSADEARQRLATRSESERNRFLARYHVDKTRLRNYDLVCDSTSASPEEIVERILVHVDTPRLFAPDTRCLLDPHRIRVPARATPDGPLLVGYVAPDFFAISGQDRVTAAIRDGAHLVEARLAAEADEQIAGRSCRDYVTAFAS
jgi:cytidylate kinase